MNKAGRALIYAECADSGNNLLIVIKRVEFITENCCETMRNVS